MLFVDSIYILTLYSQAEKIKYRGSFKNKWYQKINLPASRIHLCPKANFQADKTNGNTSLFISPTTMAMLQCFLGFEITDPKVDSSLELRWIDFSWLCDWSRKGPPSFSRASRSFGCFTLSSHWLFTKFSLALIGSCRHLGIDLKIRNRKALQRIFSEWVVSYL